MTRYLKIVFIAAAQLAVLSACGTANPEDQVRDIENWQAEWIGAPWEGESFVPEAEI